MINLKRNISNTFALTLSELTSEPTATFFISFINEMTKEIVNFTLTDNSVFKSRYNEFTLTSEQVDELIGDGFYVYEARAEEGEDLLERGLCYVYENENNTAFYNADYINKEYGE